MAACLAMLTWWPCMIGGGPTTVINHAPCDLFASPLARQKPPAVTPTAITAHPNPRKTLPSANLKAFIYNRLIVILLVGGKGNTEYQWQETLSVESSLDYQVPCSTGVRRSSCSMERNTYPVEC